MPTRLRESGHPKPAEWPSHIHPPKPMEVLEASMRHASAVCGQAGSLGTLEAGKLADLIVVKGDPLADLSAMDSVIAVVKGGEVAFRTP